MTRSATLSCRSKPVRRGRPKSFTVKLSEEEREVLNTYARSRSLPHALVRRAKIVVMAADGLPNGTIAEKLDVSNPTITNWCRRYIADGIAGLYDLPPGHRRRTYDDDEVARLMQKALAERPEGATHWSTRSFARKTALSKSTVQRYFTLFGIQPHRSRTFKLSTDPFFVEKVRDIVGLYLDPPDNALVLCVDEKSSIAPSCPCHPPLRCWGSVMSRVSPMITSDTAQPLCSRRSISPTARSSGSAKRGIVTRNFCPSSITSKKNVPADLDVHLVMDNYGTHKHPKVRAWFARRPSISRPLHADLRVMAQPGRTLVRFSSVSELSGAVRSER